MAGPLSDAASRHPPVPPSLGAAVESSNGSDGTSPIYARFARPHEQRGSGLLFDTSCSASGKQTALLPSSPVKSFLRVDAPTPPPGRMPTDRTESHLSVDANTPPVSSGPQQTPFKGPAAIALLKGQAAEPQADNYGTGVASLDVRFGDDRLYRPTSEYVTRSEPKQPSRASKFLSALNLKPVSPVAKADGFNNGASSNGAGRDIVARKSTSSIRAKLSSSLSSSSVNRVQPDRNAAVTSPSSITSFESAIDVMAYAAPGPVVHDVGLRQQEPPTMSPKALDVLIGLPPTTAPKAVSTLTGIQVQRRPALEQTVSDEVRQSVVSVQSALSTTREDGDQSDDGSVASTIDGGDQQHSAYRDGQMDMPPRSPSAAQLQWEAERARKASASSDGSFAAEFILTTRDAPPASAIPAAMLARNGQLRDAEPHKIPSMPADRQLQFRPFSVARDSLYSSVTSAPEPAHTSPIAPPGQTQSSRRTRKTSLLASQPGKEPVSSDQMGGKNSNNGHERAPRLSKPYSDASHATSTSTLREREGGGPRKTLASLYLVAGLAKDPANWTLADTDIEPSHLEQAVPRWFKAEVLGTMVSGGTEGALEALDAGETADPGAGKGQSRGKKGRVDALGGGQGRGGKGRSAPPDMGTIEEVPSLSKEEVAKIQAKAIKLSLPRDVEVVAAAVAPPTTSHTFSFTIKASPSSAYDGAGAGSQGPIKGALGASWDLALAQAARPAYEARPREDVYYAATLIVWTHADRARSDAIRATVATGSKARTTAIAKASKAAAAGRKYGERLARQSARAGGTGKVFISSAHAGATSGDETELQTEAFLTESEWEGNGTQPLNASATQLPFFQASTFWLPYALTLVSKYPIYDLLTDTIRISWARYHLNISRHSLTMRKMLEFPAPRPSERFKVPVDPLVDADGAFVCRFPGRISLGTGSAEIDHQIWPILRCLSADNLLRIAEIALAPFGRVLFVCRHLFMLNLAAECFRHLLEPRGWTGLVHGIVHARDVRVFVEDPGPFLIGLDSRCINLAHDLPAEVCIVDLETNDVRCRQPPPLGFVSRGTRRDRTVKKLADAIGNVGFYGVPAELQEAFPGSRFRPFSTVEVNGKTAPAERLLPPATWPYNQERFIAVFDEVLSTNPSQSALARLLHLKSPARTAAKLSSSAQHVQQIVRNQSSSFVDKRDLLEARLWRMNRKLGALVQSSRAWEAHVSQFASAQAALNAEASELRTRLEKERREARRLSGIVETSRQKQSELAANLARTQAERVRAEAELAILEERRKEMQQQRDAMFDEMAALVAATDDQELLEVIASKVEFRSETMSARSASTNGHATHQQPDSYRPQSASSEPGGPSANRRLSVISATFSAIDTNDDHAHQEQLALQKMAISETMKSVQNRLQQAMSRAEAGFASGGDMTHTEIPASPRRDTLRPTSASSSPPPRSPGRLRAGHPGTRIPAKSPARQSCPVPRPDSSSDYSGDEETRRMGRATLMVGHDRS